MAKHSFFALLILSLLVLNWNLPAVRAQEGGVEEESSSTASDGSDDASNKDVVHVAGGEEEPSEQPVLEPAPGVNVAFVFPNKNVKAPVIPAGEYTEVIVGLLNGAETDLRVTGLEAKLLYPLDYRVAVQNFTLKKYDTVVSPNTQSSFQFSFTPEKNFQPRDFGFTGWIFYEISGEAYASVFWNGTIEIIEPRGMISGESIFLFLLGSALFALFSMWLTSQIKAFSKKARRTKKAEASAEGDDAEPTNEWLQGTFFSLKPPKHTSLHRIKPKRKKIN